MSVLLLALVFAKRPAVLFVVAHWYLMFCDDFNDPLRYRSDALFHHANGRSPDFQPFRRLLLREPVANPPESQEDYRTEGWAKGQRVVIDATAPPLASVDGDRGADLHGRVCLGVGRGG